jgi:phosphatidylglycerophosphate synthase
VTPTAAQALLPLIGLLAFLLGTLAVFAARCALFGVPDTPEIAKREHTIIARALQEWWVWLFRPAERLCVRLGISPDALTVASALAAVVAGALLGAGHLSVGGWVYLFGASLDFIDGRVARATGRVTRAGAFLDSTLDRVAELAVLIGLAVALKDGPFVLAPLAAAAASVLVSYARARGEALGAGGEAKVGGMQRPERVIVTGAASALSPLADALGVPGGGRGVVGVALTLLAVSSALTAARRIWAIYSALRAAEPGARPAARRLAHVFRLEAGRRRDAIP